MIPVVDAMGKLPSGVLQGDVTWLGSFSACRSIHIPAPNQSSNATDLFKGQYCLTKIGNRSDPLLAFVSILSFKRICLFCCLYIYDQSFLLAC